MGEAVEVLAGELLLERGGDLLVAALERAEQSIRVLGVEPGAVVAYLHAEVLTLAPSADLDACACGVEGELECVGEQAHRHPPPHNLSTNTAGLISLSRSLQRNAIIESVIVARYTAVACSLPSRVRSVIIIRLSTARLQGRPLPDAELAKRPRRRVMTGKRRSEALFCPSDPGPVIMSITERQIVKPATALIN